MATATTSSAVSSARDVPDPNEVIRRYAANPAFRSATAEELVNESNPFRRPVRPDDLQFLDYGRALDPWGALSLSSLLGHRMLLNIYEAELLFLPPTRDCPAWTDFSSFYSTESTAFGERARPILEKHLFTFLDASPPEGRAAGMVRARCVEAEAHRERAERKVARRLLSRRDPDGALRFLLLQLTCGTPARSWAIARGAIGDYANVHPALVEFALEQGAAARQRSAALPSFLESVGLVGAPRAYWQFYLTSSMATVNNLYRLARDHSRFFEFVGALFHEQIRERCFRDVHRDVVDEACARTPDLDYFDSRPAQLEPGAEALFGLLVEPLIDRYGGGVEEAVLAGLDGASRLQDLADHDLMEQITWADSLDEYKAKAHRLHEKIERDGLEIDLDRYVEASGETSTTHVHDDNRLVVVQDGEMHFWNNVGTNIALSVGEKLLVPRGRLHGSVVRSGECIYDQPVIPDALIAALG